MTISLKTEATKANEGTPHEQGEFETPSLELNNNEALAAQLGGFGGPEEDLVITAQRKITLQCGQSSITLHANGKIVLRGEYIVSAAEGTNRIVGGQIEIN
ncbi:hypothetical protein [Massilia rubra]|uniref:DUF3060 domain-containing protein n=1 Tax=Massilia rubra TaxID=2607910 RepID=A0ABX0LY74_9BURK|nr:hypothetical protein [Massilia rubra]NHZ37795.1 hypothetical protein [Massilia rubra]